MHNVERVIRIIIGAILISLAFWGPRNLWFLVGLIPLLTSLVGWCPLYAAFGFSTCQIKKES